jgi:hypothetical protein
MVGSVMNTRPRLTLTVAVIAAAVVVLLLVLTDILPTASGPLAQPRIGILSAHSPRETGDTFVELATALGQSFEVCEIDAFGDATLADALDSLDVLVLLGSGHMPDARLYEIDQFLMRGGRAAFLLDGAGLSRSRDRVTVVRGNMFAFVGSYGAKVNPDLVVDPEDGSTSYPETGGSAPYAYWPVARLERQPRGGVRVGSGEAVFSWASTITLSATEDAEVSVLAELPPEAWTVVAFEDVGPGATPERIPESADVSDALGTPDALAVAMDGVFASAFGDAPVIVERDDGSVDFTYPPGRIGRSGPTRIFVGGSSSMFSDFVLARAPDNLELMLAVVAWLAAR